MDGSQKGMQERSSVDENPRQRRYLAFEVVGKLESAEEALLVSNFDLPVVYSRWYLL